MRLFRPDMTTRLYFQTSYLQEFSAAVLERRSRGGHPAVILDQTAFYPSSGGQPYDTGILDGARVLEVEEDPTGVILHVLDRPLQAAWVAGKIDWDRRFDHMQQHTGQHILSQGFVRAAEAATLSFHMGTETSTIDVDLSNPEPSLIEQAEQLANNVIFEDHPVNILEADRDQLSALGIRKESDRTGKIRIIEVEGFDRSACGGTHVRHTGEIGLLFILGWENYKGGVRIEFACGRRALTAFRHEHEILKRLSKLCSAHANELPRLVEKMLLDRSMLLRENSRLHDQILEHEAIGLLDGADTRGGVRLVNRNYSDRTVESLKILAQKLAAQPGTVAILGLVAQDTAQVVLARSTNVPGNCGAIVKAVSALMGGKGGGKPEQAQAGGIAAAMVNQWMQAAAEKLTVSEI